LKTEFPLVSILTTNYNGAEYIDDAIKSLLNQTYSNWEHIIIENGSTDNSIVEILKYRDSRIQLIKYENNIGRTKALVVAAKAAKGEYICVLDIDDTFELTKIEEQVNYLNNHQNVSVIATSYNLINKVKTLIDKIIINNNQYKFPNIFSHLNPIAHSSVMFRKKHYEFVKGYDESLIFAQDFDLWIKLSQVGEIKFIEKPLTNIRITASSMSNDKSQEKIRYQEVTKLFLKSKLISGVNLTKEELKLHKIEILNRKLNVLLNTKPRPYINISTFLFKYFKIKFAK
jgi:glycosyltransferase involved in cell wall biosynthesis